MTSATVNEPSALRWRAGRMERASLGPWMVLALALIAARALVTTWPLMPDYLGDMDDATRLMQVRALLAGAPWYDTWTPVMGGKAGMLSHWSRLVDLPIALLLTFFKAFTSQASAELLTRAVWPLMVLAPLLGVLAVAAERLGERAAALIVLALAVMSPMGLYQFNAGRIDHHNVMIACTVSAALLIAAFPLTERIWTWAGALTGLALAVGYEALAPAAVISTGAAIWGLLSKEAAGPARRFTGALMATLAASFVATIPPARWLDIRCDAMSLNMVALILIGGGGLSAVLGRHADWPLAKRLALVGAAGLAGLAIYGALEPKCLAGPLGQLPQELKPIWLVTIGENRSIFIDLVRGNIEQSLGLIAYFALGVAAAAACARSARTPASLFLFAVGAAFVLFALWQYKYVAYATFILAVPLALLIAALPAVDGLSAPVLRMATLLFASQAVFMQASKALEGRLHPPGVRSAFGPPEACLKSSAVRDLAALAPGLIAARIDIGAYIAALTPHRVLSAPYHRIADAIIANHKIFAATTPAEAAALLEREGVDYVVTCRNLDDPYVGEAQWRGTLRARLVASQAPDYLVPVALGNSQTLFKVWRVDRAKLP